MSSRLGSMFAATVMGVSALIASGLALNARAAPQPIEPRAPTAAVGDWPQLGHDAQRTNATTLQVNPPYCYTWKWYEAPLASRAQPVVAQGRLFIGSMNGLFYARNASTGAPLWTFDASSPIRHAAGVISDTVIFSTHAGQTFALDAATGAQKWQTDTGSSSTAPLIDEARGWVYVTSSNGTLTALRVTDGVTQWQYTSGAPILTTPALSLDGQRVFLGDESIDAIAVNANTGVEVWRTPLQGQSLAERYPVVVSNTVIYRSQPLNFFHHLLQEGDATLNLAGSVNADWAIDWANVKPNILTYFTQAPEKQTFFTLDASTGASRGLAPILYTYGNNDIGATPVIRNGSAYVVYRPRHGIQTDGGSVHVSSQYDAELGQMNLNTLDITGLRQNNYPNYSTEFRLTSDEPAMLTQGGNILYVDNWERLGGISLTTSTNGTLLHVGNVSNVWPECLTHATAAGDKPDQVQCGPSGPNPFFPLSGNPNDPAYPFPSPRVTDGHARGGVVIANNMLYWRVIEGGLAGIGHQSGASCPAPLVYTHTVDVHASLVTRQSSLDATRPLTDYVALDLTTPVAHPPADLVQRLRAEVRALVSVNQHVMPLYLERGFSVPDLWPYDVPSGQVSPSSVAYNSHGNVYWHDPGELLYSLALAYPYLDTALQISVTQYVSREVAVYAPLADLPWGDSQRDWLRTGRARERYTVPFRSQLNNWPPPAASMSALYAVWLWSKTTGDWSYAQAHWSDATALFNARKSAMNDFYSDIAGAIGYARLAAHFGNTSAYTSGVQAAVGAMQAGRIITTYIDTARNTYLDPRDQATGWYLPVFFGLTPEVGLYLREQTNGLAQQHIASREDGDGLRWWYLTRAGAHAEVGETSYVAPIAAWSHFLAHAYIDGDAQETLRTWLDRPWAIGDLYSIQKIVATIQAAPLQPDFNASYQQVSKSNPMTNESVTYTLGLRNDGKVITDTLYLTDSLPSGLLLEPGSCTLAMGDGPRPAVQPPSRCDSNLVAWQSVMTATSAITLTFRVTVTEASTRAITNTAVFDVGSAGAFTRSTVIIANGHSVYLPVVRRN